jgi:quercetin dioxygenase-like cupin family protein
MLRRCPRPAKRVWSPPATLEEGATMRTVAFAASLLIGSAALTAPARAQPAPAPAVVRTVLAAARLPTVTDAPRHFRVVAIALPPGGRTGAPAADGILYHLTGMAEVAAGGEGKVLREGEGLFVGGTTGAALVAGGGGPSTLLHFVLGPAAAGPDLPPEAREVYRTAAPIPDLKPGAYDINLTRVTFPAGMPSNAPHHRSGAALYHILSGTGANTVGGVTEPRGPGAFVYEPFGLVHQWGNPASEPLTFLAFNINPEGVAAVLPGAPGRAP